MSVKIGNKQEMGRIGSCINYKQSFIVSNGKHPVELLAFGSNEGTICKIVGIDNKPIDLSKIRVKEIDGYSIYVNITGIEEVVMLTPAGLFISEQRYNEDTGETEVHINGEIVRYRVIESMR